MVRSLFDKHIFQNEDPGGNSFPDSYVDGEG